MSDYQNEFRIMRPLIDEQIKDLKAAVEILRTTCVEQDKQIALINQKILFYTTTVGLVATTAVQLAVRFFT